MFNWSHYASNSNIEVSGFSVLFNFECFQSLFNKDVVCVAGADGHRWRRQADDAPKKEDSLEQELCKDKDAGEWFRLVAGEGDNCRDVIQCTASVSTYI